MTFYPQLMEFIGVIETARRALAPLEAVTWERVQEETAKVQQCLS